MLDSILETYPSKEFDMQKTIGEDHNFEMFIYALHMFSRIVRRHARMFHRNKCIAKLIL